MHSVWLCTRNDVIANIAVLVAAAGVFGTGTVWPDVAVAAILAVLGLSSGRSRPAPGARRAQRPGAAARLAVSGDLRPGLPAVLRRVDAALEVAMAYSSRLAGFCAMYATASLVSGGSATLIGTPPGPTIAKGSGGCRRRHTRGAASGRRTPPAPARCLQCVRSARPRPWKGKPLRSRHRDHVAIVRMDGKRLRLPGEPAAAARFQLKPSLTVQCSPGTSGASSAPGSRRRSHWCSSLRQADGNRSRLPGRASPRSCRRRGCESGQGIHQPRAGAGCPLL